MDNLGDLVSVATLVVIIGAALFGRRILTTIRHNVNSNLDIIRRENADLNEEVRRLLGREHSLETLQAATEKRAEKAEKVVEAQDEKDG